MAWEDRIKDLDLGSLQNFRDHIDKKIKDAYESEKKTMWFIQDDWLNIDWFPEEEGIQALEKFLEVCKDKAPGLIEKVTSTNRIGWFKDMPKLTAIKLNEVEYQEFLDAKEPK